MSCMSKCLTGEANNPVMPYNIWNRIDGDSTIGNWLRNNVPLVNGMFGDVGDIVSGVGNMAVGLVTFDQYGALVGGFNQLGGGTLGLGQIEVMEAGSVVAGAIGKVYVTGWDTVNLLTGGQLALPDQSGINSKGDPISSSEPTGWQAAVTSFFKDAVIPEYGLALGPQWGTTEWGLQGYAFNQADYYSWEHDQTLDNHQWDINQYHALPPGVVPDGPIAAAIVLYGKNPFWLAPSPHH